MKPHRPVLRFNTGPLYERQPDGTNECKGEGEGLTKRGRRMVGQPPDVSPLSPSMNGPSTSPATTA